MLRDYSRLESAKAIGIGINEIQGLRRNGTQDSQRKQALEQAYGDVVGIAQEQDWHPQLLLLTWLILSRSIAESSRK